MSVYEEVMANKSSSRVYPKNSFDRFGDDLTELILQYLTLEDKVRLECVSKQWRRLVFNKQFTIEIDSDSVKGFRFYRNNTLNVYRLFRDETQFE